MRRNPARHNAFPVDYLQAHVGVIFVFLYLPIVILIVLSFNDSTITSFPFKGFTLKWFAVLFEQRNILKGLLNSFVVSLATIAIVVTIGTVTAYTLIRYDFRGRMLIGALVFVPIIVPKTVLGLALVTLTSYLDIPRSLFTVIFAHVLFCFPYVTIVVASVFLRLEPSLIDAASDLGAGEWRTVRKVVLPLVKNGIIAGAFVAFVLSFSEFNLSSFLSGRDQTLPLVIFSEFRFKVTPKINALSSLVVLANVLLVILAEFQRNRRVSWATRRRRGAAAGR